MSDERTREHTDEQPAVGGPGSDEAAANLAQIRERAQHLHEEGSSIVQAALSGNSQRFLELERIEPDICLSAHLRYRELRARIRRRVRRDGGDEPDLPF